MTILIALLGGILPSGVWLAFWLMEDRCAPEPKGRLLLTFLAGMAAVGLVLPVERFIAVLVGTSIAGSTLAQGMLLLLLWAAVEELSKLGAASIFGLESRAYDEPLDAVVYLTTSALGFAAAENALYLFVSLADNVGTSSLLTGDLRFVGATLLHTLASATIGLTMAFFFYSSRAVRIAALVVGVILAVALHTLFNFFILWAGSAQTLYVFLPIWLGVALVLALLERIKNPAKDYC